MVGRCVHVWVRDDLLDERLRIDTEKLATIGRMPGNLYCRTRETFSLPRGRAALELAPPFPEDVGASSARGAEPSELP